MSEQALEVQEQIRGLREDMQALNNRMDALLRALGQGSLAWPGEEARLGEWVASFLADLDKIGLKTVFRNQILRGLQIHTQYYGEKRERPRRPCVYLGTHELHATDHLPTFAEWVADIRRTNDRRICHLSDLGQARLLEAWDAWKGRSEP